MDTPRSVTVLGSTGSVGTQTLELIARHRDAYTVEALTANGNVALLARQAIDTRAKLAVVGDESKYADLRDALSGSGVEVAAGAAAVVEAGRRPAGWVMAAIVGAAGLPPTMAAVERGAVVAFANKEVLVSAGALMMDAVARHGATLLPVDSEHSAIFQCFDATRPRGVRRLILTASGGPFRDWNLDRMAAVTPAMAVAHPVWSMGAKISVDSATMMNKGLEVIEAHHLFAMAEERIDIVVHPQSVAHSFVEYIDGSVLAQLGTPDMRTPIAYALAWPHRMETPAPRLDLTTCGSLTFEAPDETRFPALRLARAALRQGGCAPTILNAANEVAVAAFLDGRIGFLDIARVVEATLSDSWPAVVGDIAEVIAIDVEARRAASARVADWRITV